jgi:hypothetical protein
VKPVGGSKSVGTNAADSDTLSTLGTYAASRT